MKDRNFVREVFGYRIRLYFGTTMKSDRYRFWKSDLGSRGVYLRFWKERVLGAQYRKV